MSKKRFAYLFAYMILAYVGIYLGITIDIPILADLPAFVLGLLLVISMFALIALTYYGAKKWW